MIQSLTLELEQGEKMKSISNIANKKNTKIAVFIFLDLLALIISSMVAIGLRFDFSNIPTNYFNNAYLYLVYDFIIMIIIFVFFKLYTSISK